MVRVTIETASKAEAQLIAEDLQAKAEAWRGLGVIRLAAKSKQDVQELLDSVSRGFEAHGLHWARVRYGDEERVFKANGNGHRTA